MFKLIIFLLCIFPIQSSNAASLETLQLARDCKLAEAEMSLNHDMETTDQSGSEMTNRYLRWQLLIRLGRANEANEALKEIPAGWFGALKQNKALDVCNYLKTNKTLILNENDTPDVVSDFLVDLMSRLVGENRGSPPNIESDSRGNYFNFTSSRSIAMLFTLIVFILSFLWGLKCIQIVQQQRACIVENFGKYSRTLTPGLNFIFYPIQSVVANLDLRITEVNSKVNIKTNDNMFVDLPVAIQLKIDPANANRAHYQLKTPHQQISTWVLNSIRSVSSGMSIDKMYEDRDVVIQHVTNDLSIKLANYGYILEAVLIDQPTLSEEVQRSFNQVVAAKRLAEAATEQGKAERIKLIAVAEGEAEAQRQRAKGLADARKTLADGIADSISKFKEQGVSVDESINTLTEINRIDALREVGKHGNTILVDLASNKNIGLNLQTNNVIPVA